MKKFYSLKLTLNGEQIKLEPKLLGINFDPKLSFDYHFKCLEKDIKKRINIIKILKSKHWSSTQEFLLIFYKSFIRPLIDYANFPYLIANKTTKDKIQKIQKKILRICLSLNKSKTIYTVFTTAGKRKSYEKIFNTTNPRKVKCTDDRKKSN
jgi:hypothetical protein